MFLKGLIIITLGYIIYQDIKNREVYWFLLPLLTTLLGIEHYHKVLSINFVTAMVINIATIFAVIALSYLYTIVVIKKPFFKEVFGLADALYFLALAIAFPTVTFIIIFVFSLLFSLLTWFVFKSKSTFSTIPLAGYMSVFLIVIFTGNWLSCAVNLYLI